MICKFLGITEVKFAEKLVTGHVSDCCPVGRRDLFSKHSWNSGFSPLLWLSDQHQEHRATSLHVLIVLTFNFISLTPKLVQELGRWCSASASNPGALAGRGREEAGLPPLSTSQELLRAARSLQSVLSSAFSRELGREETPRNCRFSVGLTPILVSYI